MQQRDKEILNKYIHGQASVDEQARVERMCIAEDIFGLKEYVKSDWYACVNSEEIIDKDLTSVLDKVYHEIYLKENVKKQLLSRKLYRWYSTAAAFLLVPLFVLGSIYILKLSKANQRISEIVSNVSVVSPLGTRTLFELPDGSEVVLNGGSTLEYRIPFSNNRDVKLMGEAYFDVKHDENHPFMVSTNKINVKVLGTRFNLIATQDNSITEVILEQGKIECLIGQKEIQMKPNERLSLDGDKLLKTEVDAMKYTAWRNGELIFRGDGMQEVANRISRWYNVEVEVIGEELASYVFRATFRDDSLEEVLHLLKLSSPIDYKIKERVKQADGSFSKKKVTIYKKK